MTEVLRLSWSIASSGWRATWNRSVRFSRHKAALIFQVVQIAFFLFLATRAPQMAASRPGQGLAGVLALMGVQMGWFGMLYGFSRGQFQLYQGILVPLFQISPARPAAFLIGRVIEAVPSRAWTTLLWAWVYAGVIPGYSRWALTPLLALYGLAVGMVAHLSGLLLLAAWSRYSAKTMRNGLLLFGAATLALATWAVIYIARGGTLTNLAAGMAQYRQAVMAGVGLLAGIPGLLLLAGLLLRPEAVEELYRKGVYNVIELGEADIERPTRSIWLPIGEGVLRAVLSREWLQLARSRVARVQAMIWLAGTVGVFYAGRAMAGAGTQRVVLYVGALSLAAWFMAFGHWVVRVFEQERVTIALYRLTAVPTWKLMLAKFISVAVPSGLLVGISATVGALAARLTAGEAIAVMGWTMGALAAGVLGGFGMAAATAEEEPEEPDVTGLPKRAGADGPQTFNNAWWALARTAALAISMALPLWTGAGQPGLGRFKLPLAPLWTADLALPCCLLIIGAWLMLKNWEQHG